MDAAIDKSGGPRAASGRAVVHVIAGEALGAKAVIATRTPIGYLHWIFSPVRRWMCRFRRTTPPMSWRGRNYPGDYARSCPTAAIRRAAILVEGGGVSGFRCGELQSRKQPSTKPVSP
jgi:hypothetical protein